MTSPSSKRTIASRAAALWHSDFKMEKSHIDRRVAQMAAEGVAFRSVVVGELGDAPVTNWASETVEPKQLLADFDAVILAGGAEQPRDLPVPGRVGRARRWILPQQNKVVAGDVVSDQIVATGKHVIVIGGGDTGSDCRHQQSAAPEERHAMGAAAATTGKREQAFDLAILADQVADFKLSPEGVQRDWAIATKAFKGDANGKVTALVAVRVQWQLDATTGQSKMVEVPGSNSRFKRIWCYWRWDSSHRSVRFSTASVSRRMRAAVLARSWLARVAIRPALTRYSLRVTCGVASHLTVWAIREGRQCARGSMSI